MEFSLYQGSEDTRTSVNFLVSRLNTMPNINAMRVQLMMITLYGMLKSGVARSTSNMGVYILLGERIGKSEPSISSSDSLG